MKRFLFMLAAALLISAPVSAKILGIVANSTVNTDGATRQDANFIWSRMVACLGLDYDLVAATDTAAVRARAQSGDYTTAIYLNLPYFDGDNNTSAECLSTGLGLFGTYVAVADVLMTIDLIVPIPYRVFGAGSIPITEISNFHTTGANTSMVSSSGDSIMMRTLAVELPEVNTTATGITPLIWDPLCVDAGVKACFLWELEKTSGAKVYFFSYANSPFQWGSWLTALAKNEDITSVEFAPGVHVWACPDDTIGMGAGANALVNWCIANDFKITLDVNQAWHDNADKADLRALFTASIAPNRDIFDIVQSGYFAPNDSDYTGYSVNHSSGSRKAGMREAFDSIAADPILSAHLDTTTLCPVYGYLGGGDSWPEAQEILTDLHTVGVRTIYVGSNIFYDGWPASTRVGPSTSQRFWMSGDDGATWDQMEVRTASIYANNMISSTEDSMTAQQRGERTREILMSTMGGLNFGSTERAQYDNGTYRSQVQGRAEYSPGVWMSHRYAKARGTDYITTTGCGTSNVEWFFRTMLATMDLYNNVAVQIGAVGTPIVNVWVKDVKYDRVLKRRFANEHVRVE